MISMLDIGMWMVYGLMICLINLNVVCVWVLNSENVWLCTWMVVDGFQVQVQDWWDSDNGDIYPTQERYVTNQSPLILVMRCDACMLTRDLLKGFP